jgi:DNA-binding response OmpR family regulator
MTKVLIIEDDDVIVQGMARHLQSAGYDAVGVANGETGLARLRFERPDVCVLDLMLPGLDGLEVCRRIQHDRPVPVLMLTARDSETDMVVGLAVGADDYLTKPFSPRELVARVHALLRRVERAAAAAAKPDETLYVAGVALDLATRRVRRDDDTVHLTPTEFDLLAHLASHPGQVFTRGQLLVQVWGYHDDSGARTVDSHVRAVRRKLGPDVIRTVHGVGYAADDAAVTAASGGTRDRS